MQVSEPASFVVLTSQPCSRTKQIITTAFLVCLSGRGTLLQQSMHINSHSTVTHAAAQQQGSTTQPLSTLHVNSSAVNSPAVLPSGSPAPYHKLHHGNGDQMKPRRLFDTPISYNHTTAAPGHSHQAQQQTLHEPPSSHNNHMQQRQYPSRLSDNLLLQGGSHQEQLMAQSSCHTDATAALPTSRETAVANGPQQTASGSHGSSSPLPAQQQLLIDMLLATVEHVKSGGGVPQSLQAVLTTPVLSSLMSTLLGGDKEAALPAPQTMHSVGELPQVQMQASTASRRMQPSGDPQNCATEPISSVSTVQQQSDGFVSSFGASADTALQQQLSPKPADVSSVTSSKQHAATASCDADGSSTPSATAAAADRRHMGWSESTAVVTTSPDRHIHKSKAWQSLTARKHSPSSQSVRFSGVAAVEEQHTSVASASEAAETARTAECQHATNRSFAVAVTPTTETPAEDARAVSEHEVTTSTADSQDNHGSTGHVPADHRLVPQRRRWQISGRSEVQDNNNSNNSSSVGQAAIAGAEVGSPKRLGRDWHSMSATSHAERSKPKVVRRLKQSAKSMPTVRQFSRLRSPSCNSAGSTLSAGVSDDSLATSQQQSTSSTPHVAASTGVAVDTASLQSNSPGNAPLPESPQAGFGSPAEVVAVSSSVLQTANPEACVDSSQDLSAVSPPSTPPAVAGLSTPAPVLRSVHTPGVVPVPPTTPMLATSTAAVLDLSDAWRQQAEDTNSRWLALLQDWNEAAASTPGSAGHGGRQPSNATAHGSCTHVHQQDAEPLPFCTNDDRPQQTLDMSAKCSNTRQVQQQQQQQGNNTQNEDNGSCTSSALQSHTNAANTYTVTEPVVGSNQSGCTVTATFATPAQSYPGPEQSNSKFSVQMSECAAVGTASTSARSQRSVTDMQAGLQQIESRLAAMRARAARQHTAEHISRQLTDAAVPQNHGSSTSQHQRRPDSFSTAAEWLPNRLTMSASSKLNDSTVTCQQGMSDSQSWAVDWQPLGSQRSDAGQANQQPRHPLEASTPGYNTSVLLHSADSQRSGHTTSAAVEDAWPAVHHLQRQPGRSSMQGKPPSGQANIIGRLLATWSQLQPPETLTHGGSVPARMQRSRSAPSIAQLRHMMRHGSPERSRHHRQEADPLGHPEVTTAAHQPTMIGSKHPASGLSVEHPVLLSGRPHRHSSSPESPTRRLRRNWLQQAVQASADMHADLEALGASPGGVGTKWVDDLQHISDSIQQSEVWDQAGNSRQKHSMQKLRQLTNDLKQFASQIEYKNMLGKEPAHRASSSKGRAQQMRDDVPHSIYGKSRDQWPMPLSSSMEGHTTTTVSVAPSLHGVQSTSSMGLRSANPSSVSVHSRAGQHMDSPLMLGDASSHSNIPGMPYTAEQTPMAAFNGYGTADLLATKQALSSLKMRLQRRFKPVTLTSTFI